MTADEDAPGRVGQHATASDHAQNYQAGRDQHITNITQVSSHLPPVPAAAPSLLEHLVGRQEKVDELLAVLAPESPAAGSTGSGTVVVSAVAGLAGIGKTALALHTAHHAAAQGLFPGGVLHVALHGYSPTGTVSAESALRTLLGQLGIPNKDLPGEVEELAALYQSELARRAKEGGAILVVADDVSSPTQLTSLVPAHRAHRLLVTSRDTLTSPTFHARLIRLDELTPAAAAELITNAVTLQRPDDPRLAAEPEALAQVVAHCGRLPLALHIAAALLRTVPSLSVGALAKDLADTLNALQFRSPDGKQSLAVRAAFDLSYRRLAPETARVFRLLGLCVGPDLATDSAAALTNRPVRDTLHTLTTIANTGLLTEEPLGSGRWRMHDLIRLYTTELATPDSGESQAALARLLWHYTELADAADDHLRALPDDPAPAHFDNRAQALTWLDAEHPTLIATIGQHPHTTLDLALRLQRFLRLRRHLDDAITSAEHALAIYRELGDQHGEGAALNNLGLALRGVRRFEEAIDALTQAATIFADLGDRYSKGAALNNLGLALRAVRRFEDAINAHTQALAIYREHGDLHSEGQALNNLGNTLQEVRRFEEAIDALTQAATIYREHGDRYGEGQALNNLGLALREVRMFQEAIDAHTQAATIYREHGDRYGEGAALNNLGLALREVRMFQEAIDAHTQAATIFADLGEHHDEGGTLMNLGLDLQGVRRFEEAIDAHTQAATIFADLGNRHGEGQALMNLGATLQGVGRFEEAIDALTKAATIVADLGDRYSKGGALMNLGAALQGVGRFEEAIDAHTQALAIYRDLDNRHGEGAALTNLGNALQGVRRFEEAIDAHTRAATIFADLKDRHNEGQALMNLGLALRDVDRFEEAIDALTQAVAIFADLGDNHSEGVARRNSAGVVAAAKRAGGWWGRIWGRRRRSRVSQVGGDQKDPVPAAPPSPGALVTVRQDATVTQDSQVDRVAGDQHTNEPTP